MNTVWTKNTETKGNSIVIRRKDIEWASYDLPSTSHSGGGAQVYQFEDVYEGSSFLRAVSAEFGENVAQEILTTVQNRAEISEHFIANQSESKFTKWLHSVPEDTTIPVPWREKLNPFPFAQRDFTALSEIGIEVKKNNHHIQVFDTITTTPLFSLTFSDSFHYANVPSQGVRIISTEKELFIITKQNHSISIKLPFEQWRENWKNMCSEISSPYFFEDGFILRFNINRIRNEEGDYLLKVDFTGKVISKRDITAI